jgi:hypothetical protein
MSTHEEKAIAWAHKRCGDNKRERKWLEGGPIPDSYRNAEYRVRVRVLEGSPPRAILIVTKNWSDVIDLMGNKKTFREKWPKP